VIEKQTYRRKNIHPLPLQLVNALATVGPIHQIFWTQRPEAAMTFQFSNNLKLTMA
jgi:hypothetical protein